MASIGFSRETRLVCQANTILNAPAFAARQQGSQSGAGRGSAVTGDGFVREPLDHLATFAGGQFGDFHRLFGGGLFLLTARHANVPGRRGQFCV